MLYKLVYLPVARRDMLDIVKYISQELNNPTAAECLAYAFFEEGEKIREMPYANPAFVPIRLLKKEYRKAIVKNYIMLYWVDERDKTVTIARVIYSKRDYEKLLY